MKNLLFALAAASSISIAAAGVQTSSMSVGVTVIPPSSLTGEPRIERVNERPPSVLGWIRNRAQGQIVLAGETCAADPTRRFAFVKDDGGKISLTGCWQMIGDDIFINWSDGDVFSYPIASIEFSPAFNEWYERNRKEKGNRNQL